MIEVDYNGIMNSELSLEAFKKSIPLEVIEYLDDIHKKDFPKVVYTSFNGDYIGYINRMVYNTLKQGHIPINPECALGYYLATESLNNSKVDTMIACIALVLYCDEFWVYIDDIGDLKSIPEGVIAEMIAWLEVNKQDESVRVIKGEHKDATILKGLTSVKNQNAYSVNQINVEVEKIKISSILECLDAEFIFEIRKNLLNHLEDRGMVCKFVSFDFRDEKHADWARRYCYKKWCVGILPNSLLNPFVVDMVYGEEFYSEYLLQRAALLSKSDTVLLFLKPDCYVKQHFSLSIDVVSDIYYSLKNGIRIEMLDWRDAQVPKYIDKSWALTNKEYKEVFNGNR